MMTKILKLNALLLQRAENYVCHLFALDNKLLKLMKVIKINK